MRAGLKMLPVEAFFELTAQNLDMELALCDKLFVASENDDLSGKILSAVQSFSHPGKTVFMDKRRFVPVPDGPTLANTSARGRCRMVLELKAARGAGFHKFRVRASFLGGADCRALPEVLLNRSDRAGKGIGLLS